MASINISIKQEAYEFLQNLKTENKSFSDVILGFKKKQDFHQFLGKLKDLNWDEKEKEMKSLRDSFER